MRKWAWTTAEGTFLIDATDEETAYRMILARSMEEKHYASLEEAVRFIRINDRIAEIVGTLTNPPYVGDIPGDGPDPG